MEGRAFPGVCAMKLFLKLLFGGIFLWMTVMTIRTSLAMSLWQAWPTYAANPWAVATLWDAYFGFLTFYVWVVYKERKIWLRMLWFLLIMGLGNIAMSLYVLIQLMRLRGDESAETILWRRAQ
jgi:predicted permease